MREQGRYKGGAWLYFWDCAENWIWLDLSPCDRGWNVWHNCRIWCTKAMKEQAERSSGKVLTGGAGDQKTYMKSLKIGILLKNVAWSRWHSLRSGWCSYPILIALVTGEIGEADVWYKDFGETMEKWSICRFGWGGEVGYTDFGRPYKSGVCEGFDGRRAR